MVPEKNPSQICEITLQACMCPNYSSQFLSTGPMLDFLAEMQPTNLSARADHEFLMLCPIWVVDFLNCVVRLAMVL